MAFPETGGEIVSCRKDIPFQILMRLMFSCWAAIPGKETVREGVQKPADGNERRETRIGFYLHEVQIKEDSVMRSRPGWLPERQAPQSILMDVVCCVNAMEKGMSKVEGGDMELPAVCHGTAAEGFTVFSKGRKDVPASGM